ncbi:hypothetical protein UlMin_030546 [Ulmus minor]
MEGYKTVSIPLESNKALKKEDGSPKAKRTKFRSLIGSLLYLTTTRPDIMYATCLLSRFMQSSSRVHYGATKRVLRYLDWVGSVDNMRSTLGYAFTLRSGIFSWASKKQATVTQLSVEPKYIAAAFITSQVIWLKCIF